MSAFEIRIDGFHLDGEPFRIIAGAMHYFRVHPAYWKDRMQKMRLMGLNTLETYVAWNMHEPRPGEFVFDGWMDLPRYIEVAGEVGLKVIVRPGPYICSERDMGGLPAWLLKDRQMRLRCNYAPYLDAVDRYFSELLPRCVPLQVANGGPLIAMQVECEYGLYGNDKTYLTRLEAIMRAQGITVPLVTADGILEETLQYGTLPHVLETANFGSKAETHFKKLREYQPEGPLMCMEFWNGWFDHWGERHHTRTPEDAAAALNEILAAGASVCFYMFHGGTNFGFMNGANHEKGYQPTITSYDFDAPLNEQGNITPKFLAFRDVLRNVAAVPDTELPPPAPTMSIPPFELTESASLFASLDVLSSPVTSATPEPMESLGQSYGFIAYETCITGPRTSAPLTLRDLHDRAHVFVDGELVGIMEREFPAKGIELTIPPEGIVLRILVENMGRINYGSMLCDRKGITDCVMLGRQILHDWTMFPLPLDDLSGLTFKAGAPSKFPAFQRGYFHVEHPEDSFFLTEGWFKGVCWINGFNVGRYWKRGPQQTLYVPKPLFEQGLNEVILLELDGEPTRRVVEFCSHPVLNQTQHVEGQKANTH
ncbi:beta-galactosidase [bacterium]|nr:beta-galactosidase [candidate division CSSED10-310 bacterium]